MRIALPGLLQLPPELVIHTLKHLWPEELRAVAAVSRALYKATLLAGYRIRFTIKVQPGTSAAPKLGKFQDATRHAHATGVGLELTVVCPYTMSRPVHSECEDMMRADILAILSAVPTALPYLVNLYVQLPDIFDADLVAALRPAAPRLQSLGILLFNSGDYETQSLPSDLLSACAPNLREVALRNVAISPIISPDSGPIIAFRNVTHLRVGLHDDDRVPTLAPHFPNLSDLDLAYSSEEQKQPASEIESILDGLELKDLTVEDHGRYGVLRPIASATDVRKIPCVSHMCGDETWEMPQWQSERGKISARVDVSYPRDDTIDIHVVPADRSWLYTSHPDHWYILTDAFPLSGLPHLGARLEYLRLSALFVLTFVTATSGATYEALKVLRVSLEPEGWLDTLDEGEEPFGRVWPYARHVLETHGLLEEDLDIAQFPVCPLLEELTVSVYGELARIPAAELTLLVRTLRQADRSKAVRPSLVLLRVELDNPEVLDEYFSSISPAFTGMDSDKYHDDRGLWDGPVP